MTNESLMADPPNESQFTFESVGSGVGFSVVTIAIGIAFTGFGIASILQLDLMNLASDWWPLLLCVAMGITAIVTGLTSRSLGGRVVIHHGWVRVYELAGSKEANLKFEAPYSQFQELLVEYYCATEASGPGYTVTLIHKGSKPRKIALFERQEREALDREDTATIQQISSQMGIPTNERKALAGVLWYGG